MIRERLERLQHFWGVPEPSEVIRRVTGVIGEKTKMLSRSRGKKERGRIGKWCPFQKKEESRE